MPRLKVSLVTPDRQVARLDADLVVAPSVMGEVGILPEHVSLLADLTAGVVSVHAGGEPQRYAVSGGFIEVDRNAVTLLVETCEATAEIDIERAKAALKDAELRLGRLDTADPAYAVEAARARRAEVRLELGRRQ